MLQNIEIKDKLTSSLIFSGIALLSTIISFPRMHKEEDDGADRRADSVYYRVLFCIRVFLISFVLFSLTLYFFSKDACNAMLSHIEKGTPQF